MSKKDYVAIARALRRVQHLDVRTIEAVVYELSVVFREDNPRFNPDRFINFINEGR
jgi:hypothetical protein